MKLKHVTAIIAAGGVGRRFGGEVPKQFALLCGKPLLVYALAAFNQINAVTDIILTAPTGFMDAAEELVHAHGINKVSRIVPGGESRQISVYNALRAADPSAGIVLIHDGARPFITENGILDVLNCVEAGYAAVAGVPLTDTVKLTDQDGGVCETLPRERLWRAQTPQGFDYKTILSAHEQAAADAFSGTDDAVLVERLGLAAVRMVDCGPNNMKITTQTDLHIGAALFGFTLAAMRVDK
jgi:2-C-methyl-D-erythritol 4-phosphate cytidylyltransferase